MIKGIVNKAFTIELFILANLSFLALDIFVAHSINAFAHNAEWIPFYFSIFSPILLSIELYQNWRGKTYTYKTIGLLIGTTSVIVGIAGLLWHLNSNFFGHQTIKSLVYTAPFVAPLSYTGLGLLIIMNRMVKPGTKEWNQWLIFFGLSGFFGNFILALSDHAQNGFFLFTEWIPVVSSALAVGFLTTLLIQKYSSKYIKLCLSIMALQVCVGGLGFYYHSHSIMNGISENFFENLIYTAPIFAPLLFINLAILSGFGLLGLLITKEID
ncbi:MAG: hypothetical protein HOA15_03425 [Candidatus Marinimicrobia bacterium]|jgi:hypothetical protein|nr:hypothetical protein [Candidatus Neomarinimicrobiota bacterium]MBT3675135.1 hypothetical protein [Candidatus Neomarinimicrobiota bacterium]MBT4270337.1 hypothetical protein [Candidatus Neomarinimicrobiota bacterium]MBT4809494.1 hypothetical protein [Candidatus Neomarinimicrobiota bacterium]MBT6129044.1 hypothetical protein [Candidatus Neomarinimicrobiota bacterium]